MNPIRGAREHAGLTQAELAERSGVAQPNIAAYESGRRTASPQMVTRLVGATRARPSVALRTHRDLIVELAAARGLTDLAVFGSIARGEDTPSSDVDLLATAAPTVGLLDISAFALDVEDLLGAKVDIVTRGGLRPGHRIARTAVPL